MREFRRGDWTFDVIDEGPRGGECMVLLHGFPADVRSWAGVVNGLGGAFRTLALDQRGYSPRARPGDVRSYRVDELTGDVLALADAADAERFHLVGHDWGGLVAWHLVAHHPNRLHTLTVSPRRIPEPWPSR